MTLQTMDMQMRRGMAQDSMREFCRQTEELIEALESRIRYRFDMPSPNEQCLWQLQTQLLHDNDGTDHVIRCWRFLADVLALQAACLLRDSIPRATDPILEFRC